VNSAQEGNHGFSQISQSSVKTRSTVRSHQVLLGNEKPQSQQLSEVSNRSRPISRHETNLNPQSTKNLTPVDSNTNVLAQKDFKKKDASKTQLHPLVAQIK
jgi:hypothetical protein